MPREHRTEENLAYRVSRLGQSTIHARMFDYEDCESILIKINYLKVEVNTYIQDSCRTRLELFQFGIIRSDIQELQEFFEHLMQERQEEREEQE